MVCRGVLVHPSVRGCAGKRQAERLSLVFGREGILGVIGGEPRREQRDGKGFAMECGVNRIRRSRGAKVRAAAFFIVLVILGGVGCGSQGHDLFSAPRADRNPRVFHRHLGEPEYLDPGLMTESEGGDVAGDCFEGLFTYGRTEAEWPAGAAERFERSDDGLTYTFHLRRDGRWSDGTPVTAHDFEFAWKRVLDPLTASQYAAILWVLEGAREYNTSSADQDRKALRDKVGVRALDDYTLEVRLAYPVPYFKQLTAFYTYSPVPRHVVEKYGDAWTKPEHFVSNGPYVVKEWRNLERIVAERNPFYWDTDNLPFDRIVYHITQDNDPALNMYLAGEIDFIHDKIPPAHLARFRIERFEELKGYPYLGVYFYMFNVRSPPFDDVRVRRALNMAIDKDLIGDYVARGGQEAARSVVPPVLAKVVGYRAPSSDDFDPLKARRLLAEAGFPKGEGFPPIKLVYNTMENHKVIAEFIQREWKRNLGVQADLENVEWKVLLKKQNAGDFQVSRFAWIGDFLDPITFLDLFEGDNPNNRTGWRSSRYDALLEASRHEVDPQARLDLLARAEKILLDDVPIMPIYIYQAHDLVKPWLKGWQPHVQGQYPAKYFHIELSER